MKINKGINKLRFYLSFVLLGFYLTVGFIFLFTEVWADLVPKGRYLIGILLILFGVLRFYVAYRRYMTRSHYYKTKEEKDVSNE
jgi:cytochrome c biogenesis protein CcdA